MLTKKQRIVLKAINEYIEKERISPTVREIGDILGLSSTATVQGYIARRKDCSRSIRVVKEYDM